MKENAVARDLQRSRREKVCSEWYETLGRRGDVRGGGCWGCVGVDRLNGLH